MVAKGRTHSQGKAWKLVNVEGYKGVSLNPDAGAAGTGEPSQPGWPLSLVVPAPKSFFWAPLGSSE